MKSFHGKERGGVDFRKINFGKENRQIPYKMQDKTFQKGELINILKGQYKFNAKRAEQFLKEFLDKLGINPEGRIPSTVLPLLITMICVGYAASGCAHAGHIEDQGDNGDNHFDQKDSVTKNMAESVIGKALKDQQSGEGSTRSESYKVPRWLTKSAMEEMKNKNLESVKVTFEGRDYFVQEKNGNLIIKPANQEEKITDSTANYVLSELTYGKYQPADQEKMGKKEDFQEKQKVQSEERRFKQQQTPKKSTEILKPFNVSGQLVEAAVHEMEMKNIEWAKVTFEGRNYFVQKASGALWMTPENPQEKMTDRTARYVAAEILYTHYEESIRAEMQKVLNKNSNSQGVEEDKSISIANREERAPEKKMVKKEDGIKEPQMAESDKKDDKHIKLDEKDAERYKQFEEKKEKGTVDVEWLPGYHFKKKIGVIMNGDSQEERHLNNTKAAVQTMEDQNFDKVFVAQTDLIKENNKNIKQYPATKKGLDQLFNDLAKMADKDTLVVVYGTGHGKNEEGGAMVMAEPIGKKEISSYLGQLKVKGAKLVGMFDMCFSGSFPKELIEELKMEGIAFSPGTEGDETQCQFFSPYLWKYLREGADLNRDGKTQIHEAFSSAMQMYRNQTGEKEAGEYRRSIIELTNENYESIAENGRPVLIDVTATWCTYCRLMEPEIGKLAGMVGEQIYIVKITADKNPEGKELFRKLGIEDKIEGYPTLALKKGNKVTIVPGFKKAEQLGELVNREFGIKPDNSQFMKELGGEYGKKLGVSDDLTTGYLEKAGADKQWALLYISQGDLKKLQKSGNTDDVLKEIEQNAYENMAKKGAEEFFANLKTIKKEHPNVKKLLTQAGKAKPGLALHWLRDVIEAAADKEGNVDANYLKDLLANILQGACETDPIEIFGHAELLSTFFETGGTDGEALLKGILSQAAETAIQMELKNPGSFLQSLATRHPETQVTTNLIESVFGELLQDGKYADKLAGIQPSAAITAIADFAKDKPYALDVTKKAIKTLINMDRPPQMLDKTLQMFLNDKSRDRSLVNEAMKEFYSDRDLSLKMAEFNPAATILNVSVYAEYDFALAVVKTVLKHYGNKAAKQYVENWEQYKNCRYASAILAEAKKSMGN